MHALICMSKLELALELHLACNRHGATLGRHLLRAMDPRPCWMCQPLNLHNIRSAFSRFSVSCCAAMRRNATRCDAMRRCVFFSAALMPTNYKVGNGNIYKTFSEKCTFTKNVCGLCNARRRIGAGRAGKERRSRRVSPNEIKGPRPRLYTSNSTTRTRTR